MVYQQYKIPRETLSEKEKKVIVLIEEVIPQVRYSIELAQKGTCVDGSLHQLQKIESELIEMCNILNPNKYMPGFGHAIADSWDTDSKLGNMLLDVVYNYKRL